MVYTYRDHPTPSTLGHIPFVAEGCVPPHFDEVFLGSPMQAPLFNRFDDRGEENQADN
jgi:hypothetical protein